MDAKLTDLYLHRVLCEDHEETDLSNPAEKAELDIGNKILDLIKECETTDASYIQTLRDIKALAKKLVDQHTEK